MKKLLLKSSIFRFLERGIVVVTSLLLTPYFISVLGSDGYGLWILILSIMGWFNVIDLGFPQAVQRQIIRALELKDTERVNTVFSTGLVLFGVLGIISAGIMIALTQVPAIFGVTGPDQLTLVQILMVLSVKIMWGFIMNPFHGFFSGLLRFDIDANLSSLNAIAKAVLVFVLISELNIWGAVVATLVADVVTNILKVYYAKRLYPELKFRFSLASMEEIKALFAYSKHLILNGVIVTIGAKSGPLVITQILDLSSLAIQRIAINLVMHSQAFVNTITGVFSPVFNKMAAKNQNMEKVFIQTTTINLFVTSVLTMCLLIFGKVFIVLWVGSEFEYSVYILQIALFSAMCSGFSSGANNILLAQANHKWLSLISFFVVAIGLPLSIYLCFEYGLIGMAISGATIALTFNVFVKMALFKKYNDYNVSTVYKGLFIAVLLTYSIGLSGEHLVEQMQIDTWFELLLAGSIAFPFVVLICWILLLDKELKQIFSQAIMAKLKPNAAS